MHSGPSAAMMDGWMQTHLDFPFGGLVIVIRSRNETHSGPKKLAKWVTRRREGEEKDIVVGRKNRDG